MELFLKEKIVFTLCVDIFYIIFQKRNIYLIKIEK